MLRDASQRTRCDAPQHEAGHLYAEAGLGRHSPFSLASWITLRHLGSSLLMYFASCSGVPAIESKYWRSRKFFLTSGSAKIFRTSALILSTLCTGSAGLRMSAWLMLTSPEIGVKPLTGS